MGKQRFTDTQAWAMTAALIAGAIGFGIWLAGGPAEKPEAKNPVDVPIEKLVAAYSENPLNADERFKGRWLRISDKVTQIGSTAVLGQPFVMLGDNVQCVFGTEYKHELAQLRVGSEISVIGKCGGRTLGIIILDDCER